MNIKGHASSTSFAPTTRRPGGALILAGAVLTGLAYLLMPVVTVPLVGSLTAPGLSDELPDASSLGLLPLVPFAALVTVVLGGWLVVGAPRVNARRVAGMVTLACAALVALAYLIPYTRLSDELEDVGAESLGLTAATFTGSGFWFALVGAAITAVGAVVVLRR